MRDVQKLLKEAHFEKIQFLAERNEQERRKKSTLKVLVVIKKELDNLQLILL